MRLLEAQGKALFARHGIAVPRGAVWPELPPGVEQFAVKAQVAEGGRGKRGGIAFADGREDAARQAEALLETGFAGQRPVSVYLEERLDISRELYLAVTVDRDRRCYGILASPQGGVEVESVAQERLLKRAVPPFAESVEELAQEVARFLDLPEPAHAAAVALVGRLYVLARAEDVQLAEINPLALTRDGRLIAADAKVELDANAAFRHPEWKDIAAPESHSSVEREIAALGAVAVEVDPAGDVLAAVSGAGLMMATLDLLVAGGGRPKMMIDLGGTVLGEGRRLVPLFQAFATVAPRITLINAYFQTALCDDFARALGEGHARAPLPGRVVIRLKGRNDEPARELLRPLGFELHADLAPALDSVLRGIPAGA